MKVNLMTFDLEDGKGNILMTAEEMKDNTENARALKLFVESLGYKRHATRLTEEDIHYLDHILEYVAIIQCNTRDPDGKLMNIDQDYNTSLAIKLRELIG